ncbi:MAG: hypothetical protein OEW11_00130 [Nitrospirota bacterium]|nr:hypothetical protein [Nitrospirota bacterium]
MSEIRNFEEDRFVPDLATESPFLCNFCEDIQFAADSDLDIQRELDICRKCVRIDRSVRFADFLLIQ